ncbi:MAG: putative PEP-binding protein, partial [Lacticaseibacillus paracasei]
AAGDPIMVPLLLGMGLDEYSMSATSVLKVRSLMKNLSTADMAKMDEIALNQNITNDENADLVKKTTGQK